jgi:UDP-3-O-acyl N-acetylglucosamine deacetylase
MTPVLLKRHSYRYQRTIGQPVEVSGMGLLSSRSVRLQFVPAPASAGVAFVRTDLSPPLRIPASVDQVSGTSRCTTLGHGRHTVALVEHVLAALAGLRIDNCTVEVNGPEPPGMDGSSRRFVEVLQQAGILLQGSRRAAWCTTSPITVARNGGTLTLHPASGHELKMSYVLDFGPFSPIQRQIHTEEITPERFVSELAHSRTFLLEHEAEELRRQGVGSRTTTADLLVFGSRGPIENRLRHADEPARHKILDMVGDLSLLGHDLRGHLVAYRSGHALNVEMVRVLKARLAAPAFCNIGLLSAA